jgi:DNA-binding transcriptional LysR family regulator
MTNNLRYFLVVAEELNIRRSAERVFISPQCMSNHIKRLEESYGVVLFQRKPRFELTPEGKALVRTLRKIQIMENALEQELKDISKGGIEGVLKIGMHTARARSMIPRIYSKFHEVYPNVMISVYNGVVAETERMVIDGELNFFIGPYSIKSLDICETMLSDENTYFVIPDNVLEKYLYNEFPQCKEKFKRGINIADFKDIPILISSESSTLYTYINNLFRNSGIEPNYIFETNSNDLLFELSSMGYGACFCPGMMLNLLYSTNQTNNSKKQHLNIFPINGHSQTRRIVLGYHKDAYLPKYALTFIETVKDVAKEMNYLIP